MPDALPLPGGYTDRPLELADAAAVTAVIAAEELADAGQVAIEEADLVADWQRPGYDVSTRSVGVLDGAQLIACAEVGHLGRCDVAVHPDHRGRGIGTAFERWCREKAGELGLDEIGMPVVEGSPGDRLLASLGYHVRHTSWVLGLPQGATVPERPLPQGYVVRAATPEEHEQVWHVQEDAFLEWSVREKDSFEAWRAGTVRRPGFEPWQLRVAVDPAGDVVAMALLQLHDGCGNVARLATRADQRGRGLAQALLVDAFTVASEHGATRSELSTDSRTGALGLYEKVGMRVTSTWLSRAIAVGR